MENMLDLMKEPIEVQVKARQTMTVVICCCTLNNKTIL